ncbi:MAG: hypothetical protein SWQ30_07300 [Thermodesulfobacteriota bacterium]|nr:hypothetical protein [Thermodesulfobacteriota bacterium]
MPKTEKDASRDSKATLGKGRNLFGAEDIYQPFTKVIPLGLSAVAVIMMTMPKNVDDVQAVQSSY